MEPRPKEEEAVSLLALHQMSSGVQSAEVGSSVPAVRKVSLQHQQQTTEVSCQQRQLQQLSQHQLETGLESQLSPSPGEELRTRLQRRNQFIFSRKTALSMDQCPIVWSQGQSPQQVMHAHTGSDTGLLLGSSLGRPSSARIAQCVELCSQKRRSVTDSPHLRVLHDSLTSLTSRFTGIGGSQENLPDPSQHPVLLQQQQQQQQGSSGTASPTAAGSNSSPSGSQLQLLQHQLGGKASRSRRKIKDSRDRLADSLRQCESTGLPKPENFQQIESLCLEVEPFWDRGSATEQSTDAPAKSVRQQAAIWELLQTEINILRHLKTIIEVYVTVIKHLQSTCNLLTDVSTELLFPGISEVFQSHFTLWTEHLQPAMLRAGCHPGGRVNPAEFYPGFAEFPAIFQQSAELYCLRIAEARDYLKVLEKNDAFNDFVRWAQKISQRNYNLEDVGLDLQLASLMTMPLQRVMKYGLLLQEILKHTDDGEERLALETMIGHVTSFCNQLNATYRTKCDQADLRCVADRIEDPKLLEWMDSLGEETAGFLESYRLNLTRPMPHNGQQRRKLAEGDLRCKDDKGKWSEARCLLFTDLLLLAKSSKRNSLRLLKPPLRLDRLVLHRLGESYAFLLVALTDFGSVDTLVCLAGDSQKASDDWIDRFVQSKAALLAQLAPPTPSGQSSLDQQAQQDSSAIRMRQHSRGGRLVAMGNLHSVHSSCDVLSQQHLAAGDASLRPPHIHTRSSSVQQPPQSSDSSQDVAANLAPSSVDSAGSMQLAAKKNSPPQLQVAAAAPEAQGAVGLLNEPVEICNRRSSHV